MLILKFAIPMIFIILGILLKLGKGGFLIAGYNTASKEEKEKYDEKALCIFMENLLFLISAIILINVVAELFSLACFDFITKASPVVIVFIVIGTIVYANTGNRFEKH